MPRPLDIHRHRPRGPRLMLLLLGMAALPMIFVGWIAATEYREVGRTRALADETRHQAEEIARLDELRLQLVDEQAMHAVTLGSVEFGVPLSTLARLTGTDFAAEEIATMARVDELVSTPPGASFRLQVSGARAQDDLDLMLPAFTAVINGVEKMSADLRFELEDRAGDVPAGSDVVAASRIAAAASTARIEHTRQLWTYLQGEFSALADASPSYAELATQRDSVRDALDHIERKVLDGSPAAAALDTVRASADVTTFDAAIDAALRDLFDPDSDLRSDDVDPVLRAFQVVDLYHAGDRARPAYDELRSVSDDDMAATVSAVVDAAEADFRSTVILLAVVGVVSLVGAVALARYIGRPMVELAVAAERLGSGGLVEISDRGPREARKVGGALRQASVDLMMMERLEHEATHDELTGLPTRRLVREQLTQALARSRRNRSGGAVMFVDVDHFKEINDTYGHAAGDAVLCIVSERIRGPLREADVVGRYGGDEFIVVGESIGSADDADRLADRIVASVAAPIDLRHVSPHPAAGDVLVSVSVGVAVFEPWETSIDDVLVRADLATYEAKTAGRNRAVLAEAGRRPVSTAGWADLS